MPVIEAVYHRLYFSEDFQPLFNKASKTAATQRYRNKAVFVLSLLFVSALSAYPLIFRIL